MKILIITVISTFIISAGITIFLTGTFRQSATDVVEVTEANQPEAKQQETLASVNAKQKDIQQEKPGNPTSESNMEVNKPKSENNAETNKLKTELEQYKAQVEAEKTKLATIKSEIGALSNPKSSTTNGQQLAKVYSSMKPDTAALVLCELDESLTTQILTQMNNSSSAKIMDAITKKNPEYAAKISKNMILTKNGDK